MSSSSGLIAGYSLTEPGEEWEEMLAAFRALGGVASNICLGRGQFGRGLFPIDPDRPCRLSVPKNLMFPVEEISFAGDRIRINESSGIPKTEREFFDRYANALSWGGGGRQELTMLVSGFDALPENVRTLLVAEFGMAPWLEGEPETRVQQQFLHSRAYWIDDRHFLIPMFELANHDCRGLEWSTEDGVEIAGDASGEILMSYGLHDPFSMFHRFAIASRQPVAFSLPLKVEIGAMPLAIERSFEVVRRGEMMLPRLADSGEGLTLSFLTLGHADFVKLPKSVFRTLIEPLGVENVDEQFERILHANWATFLKLLGALETLDGKLVVDLRNMAQYQLEAMSLCIGAREL